MTRFEEIDAELLPGFQRQLVPLDSGEILTLRGGNGPPLLMLHGDPQTHLCWHRLAPALAQHFTLVLTDIRGRGESHKPAADTAKGAYTKRAMAQEQVAVMRHLGHERFSLVGHDRGARVARRMALDHPEAIERLVLMDIIPALDFYENTSAELAQDYFYFFFLTQPYPLPETLIAADRPGFLKHILGGLSDRPVNYHASALEAYLAANATPEGISAMCECFRDGFHIDRQHDTEDWASGRTIICPSLIMWGEQGVVAQHFDVPRVWSRWCDHPQFLPMPAGHFIPEEAPEETLNALMAFLN